MCFVCMCLGVEKGAVSLKIKHENNKMNFMKNIKCRHFLTTEVSNTALRGQPRGRNVRRPPMARSAGKTTASFSVSILQHSNLAIVNKNRYLSEV